MIEKMERETGFEPAKSSLVSCGRLAIGPTQRVPRAFGPDSGGSQPPRRLPDCAEEECPHDWGHGSLQGYATEIRLLPVILDTKR